MAAPAKQRKPENDLQTRVELELSFRAQLTPTSARDEDRTIDLVWSVGSEVRRYDWRSDEDYLESLSMEPKHVRLGRLNDGGPVLDTHSRWSVRDILGSIVPGTAKVDGKQGTAKVRFSMRDDVTPIWNDVKAGIVRSVSVGYQVHKWERTPATDKTIAKRMAVDWEPHEVSMVPVPADAGAGTRSADEALAHSRAREADMNAEEQKAAEDKAKREAEELRAREAREADAKRAAEAEAKRAEEDAKRAQEAAEAAATRAVAIADLCDENKIDAEQRSAWLRGKDSVTAIKAAILDMMSARSKETHISPITGGDGRREQNAVRDASDAILLRSGEKVEGEGHRHFAGGRLLRVAEQILGMGGVNTRTLDPSEIAKRALATSDFASVLYLVGEKQVRKGYESMPLVHRDVFRKTTANDFREKNQVLVSAGGILQEIPENGVIPLAGATTEQSKYRIKSYGLTYAFTRKMIIDDDISAVTRIAQSRGRSVAETERKLVWDFIMQSTLAGPLAQDGNRVFDNTNHANFPATSGTPIAAGTLTSARVSFGNRLGPDGFAMNAQLKHIVTSVVGEADWDVLLNGMYVPTSTTGVVTDRMRQVQLHVEPLISATKKHWYGFTDYNQVDHFEYAYLAGNEGARLEQRNGFNPEGIEYKVCLDFGIGAIDYRGCYLQRET